MLFKKILISLIIISVNHLFRQSNRYIHYSVQFYNKLSILLIDLVIDIKPFFKNQIKIIQERSFKVDTPDSYLLNKKKIDF